MAFIEINKNPSRRELNWFGILLPLFFALIGAVCWWRAWSETAASVLWMIAAGAGAVYWLAPPLRRTIYLGWMYAALPMGWMVSHALLAMIYYLVFTPIGLVMRCVGYDPMHRRIDRAATSYWIERPAAPNAGRYFRQF